MRDGSGPSIWFMLTSILVTFFISSKIEMERDPVRAFECKSTRSTDLSLLKFHIETFSLILLLLRSRIVKLSKSNKILNARIWFWANISCWRFASKDISWGTCVIKFRDKSKWVKFLIFPIQELTSESWLPAMFNRFKPCIDTNIKKEKRKSVWCKVATDSNIRGPTNLERLTVAADREWSRPRVPNTHVDFDQSRKVV